MELAEKRMLRKYAVHFVRTMLMLGAVFALGLLLEPEESGRLWKTIVLTAIAAVSIYFLWGTWRIVQPLASATDEMGTTIWTRGASYAHSASILLAAVYGLLETFAGLPRVSMTLASVVMIVIGFASVGLVQRRYT